MFAKLQLNKPWPSDEELCQALIRSPEGLVKRKVMCITCLCAKKGKLMRRNEFVRYGGISTRTLQRWIHEFNAKGLDGILQSHPEPRGRKRSVDRTFFHDQVLPEAERAVRDAGELLTVRALFRSAQSLGLFSGSHSTFRRYLGGKDSNYHRARTELTLEEWLMVRQTGRWPVRLRGFSRRRAKEEQQAWQQAGEVSQLQRDAFGDERSGRQ